MMNPSPTTHAPQHQVTAPTAAPGVWSSTVGLKLIVAATGVVLLLFAVGHMAGNLQVFLGREVFNAYGEKLRAIPALLWIARTIIAFSAIIHVVTTIRLTLLNNSARPVAYRKKQSVKATLASRTMVLSGLMLLAFVVYHLAHYTWKITNPQYQTMLDAHGSPDIYAMVISGFSNPLITISYVIAMVLLGFHLSHGISSVFQTAGLATTHSLPKYERAAFVITVVLVGGYISIPLAILLGVVR